MPPNAVYGIWAIRAESLFGVQSSTSFTHLFVRSICAAAFAAAAAQLPVVYPHRKRF